MKYQGFVGPSYTLQSQSADCQRTLNLYPQLDESGMGKSRYILLSTPGLNQLATYVDIASGGVRGSYKTSDDRLFVVVGEKLIEVAQDFSRVGVYELAGELGRTSMVSMTDNGLAVMIVTGPRGYFFDLTTNTVTPITDDVFEGADTCAFLNGYFVFNQPGTQKFWITDIYSDTIDPLGFASAEGNPDLLICLLVDHEELWLFGETSTEVWYDSGDANFPFAKIQGAFIEQGIAAEFSAQRLDNTTFWLGNDDRGAGIVWRAVGYTPVRISTHAMEQAIQRYPTITDAVSFTYQQDGHSFYVLNFPSGDATWVYDVATNMWHERAYLGTLTVNDGNLHRARPNTHTYAFGKHLVGDWETGTLYEMTPLALDDVDREIPRMRTAPFIDDELRAIFFSQFQLDMEVGIGNPGDATPPTAQPADPQITLTWSDDGGFTWSNDKTVGIGKSGSYRTRVIWRRLGRSRQRVFRVYAAQHKTRITLYDAYLQLSGGTS